MSPWVPDVRRVHRVRVVDVSTVPPLPPTTQVPACSANPMSVSTVPVGCSTGRPGSSAAHETTTPPVPTATVVEPSELIPRRV